MDRARDREAEVVNNLEEREEIGMDIRTRGPKGRAGKGKPSRIRGIRDRMAREVEGATGARVTIRGATRVRGHNSPVMAGVREEGDKVRREVIRLHV
jgi:hypothetical protein